MLSIKIRKVLLITLFFTTAFCFIVQSTMAAGCDCSQDTAVPPFLEAGADPNVLLMIDNSASMYDLAYQEPDGDQCFDDSYDNAATYAGYFDPASWYLYNPATKRFEISAAGICTGGFGTAYSNDYVCVVLSMVTVDSVDTLQLDSFKATGKFLNWATASKFDVQKLILTGGKYDAGELESEGRGCSGNRFIKQVDVSNGGNTYKLVLGVRTDYNKYDGIDTTLIDVFQITANGFVPAKCQEAIDLMMGDPTGFGQVKQAITDCMEYDITNEHQQAGEHDKQALMHSLHDCWYLDKHGDWPGGGAQGFNFEKWCSEVYTRDDPRELTPDDEAYVCFGDSTDADATGGFIGECWEPAGTCHDVTCAERALGDRERCNADGIIEYCTNWNSGKGECKKEDDWVVVRECDGAAVGAWKWAEKSDELDACITAARERFCNYIQVPQVVDPSDLQMSTGETWNLPAMLMDQGAAGQLGTPVATLEGNIEKSTAPSGLLQEFSGALRIGAMAFNYDGSISECDQPKPYVTYDCDDPDNKDGAKVIQGIGSDAEAAGHTDTLVSAINDEKADAWTPLAEAMYTAIGYYTQVPGLELNAGHDYTHLPAPITEYCQSNNVLIISDGSSTADLNPTMVAQATSTMKDTDTESAASCGDLHGSTYFDDLAYYAKQGTIYGGSPYAFEETPKNINMFAVFTGNKIENATNECNPYTLLSNAVANGGPNAKVADKTDAVLEGETPDKLSAALRAAFRSILKRAAAGSAASVISATRSGEGAVYQAIFWPGQDGIDGPDGPDVTWTGEVHALLIDCNGYLYEDTNGNKALDVGSDQKVVLYFDESLESPETRACYGTIDGLGNCGGTSKSLGEVKYLWSAVDWLDEITDTDILSNRSPYISGNKQRYIFTWNDLNNNGVAEGNGAIDSSEVMSFVPAKDWAGLSISGRTGDVPHDFGVTTNDEVDQIVSWIRGKDEATLRPRKVKLEFEGGTIRTVNWRLGDVIYSTPTSVARPVENYHLIYRDATYTPFVNQYENRRHVIYFGGNDGMIHAVNGGFYDASTQAFRLTPGGATSGDYPALGAELWAYVPYNLQPQLKCLTDPDYQHRYFIDSKPRIFDVRIFTPDGDHPNGWGTIMVVGMRLGGNTVKAHAEGDTRQFTSAYVIFDITNPEKPPTLLGELTYNVGSSVHMGYTTAIPAVVPMKTNDITKWYLILGSGPIWLDVNESWVSNRAIEGISNQPPKVAVFPLDELTTGSGAFRIPNATPSFTSEKGRYVLSDIGFVSDLITVDFDLERNYRGDAVYFGTVEGGWGAWNGKMYRLVTNADTAMTAPDSWSPPSLFYNTSRPVSAAPAAGWDGTDFWIYFGTGRFFDKRDKTDASSNAQESYYGIKEPIDCVTGTFSWATIDSADVVRTDQILVKAAAKPEEATLSCTVGATCLPDSATNFKELVTVVAGEGCNTSNQLTGKAGWQLDFQEPRERNLGQATLFGGLLTFTTYQPFDDICKPEGKSFLYAPYFQTGTPWYKPIYAGEAGMDASDNALSRLYLGPGLSTTPNIHVGRGCPTGEDEEDPPDDPPDHDPKTPPVKVFVQTSTGEIEQIKQEDLPISEAITGRMSWRTD